MAIQFDALTDSFGDVLDLAIVAESRRDCLFELSDGNLNKWTYIFGSEACLQLGYEPHIDVQLIEVVQQGNELVEEFAITLLKSCDELVTSGLGLSQVTLRINCYVGR